MPALTENAKAYQSADKIQPSQKSFTKAETAPTHVQRFRFPQLALWQKIWLLGMLLTGAWFVGAYARFMARLHKSRRLYKKEGKLYLYWVKDLASPCLAGWRHPAIYLPEEFADHPQDVAYAIAHEATHYRHGDLFWAMLRCALLVLHWYHPLVWAAAYCTKVDAEIACDADTVKYLGEEERWQYGRTLIAWTARPGFSGGLVPGSSGYLKERIQMLSKKPKNRPWMLILVACALLFTGACTMTDPPSDNSAKEPATQQTAKNTAGRSDQAASKYIGGETDLMTQEQYLSMMDQVLKNQNNTEDVGFDKLKHQAFAQAKVYDVTQKDGKLEVTMYFDFETFVLFKKEVYAYGPGGCYPVVATLAQNGDQLTLEDVWVPQDGSYFDKSLKEKLSPDVYKKVSADTIRTNMEDYHQTLSKMAEDYFGYPRSKKELAIEENDEYRLYSVEEGTDESGQYYFDTVTQEEGTLGSAE